MGRAKPFSQRAKSSGNKPSTASHHCKRGDFQMIILKLAALALGAGTLLEMFSPPDFGPDLVLAIVACFSYGAKCTAG